MWYENTSLWIFTLSVLIVIGKIGCNWIDVYTKNKYQGKSLFTLEKEERKK